jgi:hypothetical protein
VNAGLKDFDCRDVENVLSLVSDEDCYSFSSVRANRMNRLSFGHVRSVSGMVSFRQEFSALLPPYQHIVLSFVSNQLCWSFLASPSCKCPLCLLCSWDWEHFFTCSFLSPSLVSRGLESSWFRSPVHQSRWKLVFEDIANVLLVWSFALQTDAAVSLSYSVDDFRRMLREI